jgi:hypothetical protein
VCLVPVAHAWPQVATSGSRSPLGKQREVTDVVAGLRCGHGRDCAFRPVASDLLLYLQESRDAETWVRYVAQIPAADSFRGLAGLGLLRSGGPGVGPRIGAP